MKKTIFDPTLKQQLLARIDKLTPTADRKWGKMNVAQALRHMSLGNQMALGELSVESKRFGPIKKKIFRFFLLNMPVPKGKAETFPPMNMVNLNIDPTDFEAERSNLKSYIQKLSTATSFAEENSFGGKFSRDDWGRLMYNHTNHHLKQFGV